MTAHGSADTRSFYDERGWKVVGGQTVDERLFGERGEGPIRRALNAKRAERVRDALRGAGAPLRLLEAGCGGNPAVDLLPLCSHYTGVDFSATGLDVARARLERSGVRFHLRQADICALPFEDGAFDAAYSAHVLYHIPDVDAQAAAFREIARVVRKRGVAVFVLANPRPLLYPVRLLTRVVADAPIVGAVLDKIRPKAPLPYKPMPLGWMRAQLEPFGDVDIGCHALESTWIKHRVSERALAGRLLWSAERRAEERFAHRMARLGNYVQIVLRRR